MSDLTDYLDERKKFFVETCQVVKDGIEASTPQEQKNTLRFQNLLDNQGLMDYQIDTFISHVKTVLQALQQHLDELKEPIKNI